VQLIPSSADRNSKQLVNIGRFSNHWIEGVSPAKQMGRAADYQEWKNPSLNRRHTFLLRVDLHVGLCVTHAGQDVPSLLQFSRKAIFRIQLNAAFE
jgi:hypothetical protein